MADRVVLFIDYQNVYRWAREMFCDHRVDPHWNGQIDPLKLGNLVVDRSPFDRTLYEVRVYRGLPVNDRDPKAYAAARRQISKWQDSDPRVKVLTRPLRYPYGWPNTHQPGSKPGEKGIDVSLAIDFAAMAVRGQYEVGIIFSADTDLKPALEFVSSHDVQARAEVMAWHPGQTGNEAPRRLSLGQGRPFCHWMDDNDYKAVADPENFAI